MEKDINAWAAKRAVKKFASPRKMRGPTHNARTHAKCAGPHKVRGLPYECGGRQVRGHAQNARTRAKCVGRGSIARAALNARATIAWRGEWAALPTHLPRTCHSMPTQCNRGSTRVGRDEPQAPGTLRVRKHTLSQWHVAYMGQWVNNGVQCQFEKLWTDITMPSCRILQSSYDLVNFCFCYRW